MRFMVIVKATPDSEAGVMPSTEDLAAMGDYNEELAKAGVMLGGEGLHPSSAGARVRFDAEGRATVVDGPFAETKELIAGYWILQASSKDEVLEWVKKIPAGTGQPSEVEVRQVYDVEDFGDAFTPELAEQDARIREQAESQHGS
ncbi:MAG: YciI family protein [Solirubrobacteraceae bacterium]|jgi:hypothetical protein